jgi:hypothetical protein
VLREDNARIQKLSEAMQEQLSGVRVFKVGEEDVYIVGKARNDAQSAAAD